MNRSDFTPLEQGVIAAAERELGRRFKPDEFELIETPVLAAQLKTVVEAIRESDDDPAT
jgi:hypothetical protein